MYNLNALQRNVLITVEEVVFHGPTKQTIDPRTLVSSIIVAEERFIRPALGYDLYEAIIAAKNVVVTTGNKQTLQQKIGDRILLQDGFIVNAFEELNADYKKLWIEHLWKLTAECVLATALPEGFVQFGAEGTVHTAPAANLMANTGSVTPELKSIKWQIDTKLQSRIDPLILSMHDYLCRNKTKYPLYEKCPCDDAEQPSKRSNWITGIYDDDDQKCGCYD